MLIKDMTTEQLLTPNLVLSNSDWGDYVIQPLDAGDGDLAYQVLNGKGKAVNVVWATIEGATACAELLAEGYLKE